MNMKSRLLCLLGCFTLLACTPNSSWVAVDDFQDGTISSAWTNVDTQNQTDPFVPNAQVTEVTSDVDGNNYLLKKPAAEGVIGNRKAISFYPLPMAIEAGEPATLYTRVKVEYFPNNHSYGLSNLSAAEIPDAGYDAFEPMIRITDKAESDGSKNDGTLMALSGYKTYGKIQNPETGQSAKPMEAGIWYEVWAVMNNAAVEAGGQTYDLYVRGGEFETQTKVFSGGVFRMKRAAPLTHFMAICNTGSKKSPYGNGGVGYDDIYIAPGRELSSPLLKYSKSSEWKVY